MARKKFNCDTPGCDGFQFAMSPICTRCFIALPVSERVPPVPAGCDLRSFPDMPVDVIKMHGSDMHLEVTPEEGWYAFQLWMKSWHTVPAASLANDDRSLAMAAHLGRDLRTWKRIRAGAIRGFVECSDGRLYHLVLADKACNAWDVKKGRIRGANLTNSKAKNAQGIDNQQNGSRTAPRSTYIEQGADRDAPDTPSGDAAPRSGRATEQNRTEIGLQQSASTDTARAPEVDHVRLGVQLVDACGYDRSEVLEFSKVRSWINAGLTPNEIEAAIPVIAERFRGRGKHPRDLLAYLDGMIREEIAAMRSGTGTASVAHTAPAKSNATRPADQWRWALNRVLDGKAWPPTFGTEPSRDNAGRFVPTPGCDCPNEIMAEVNAGRAAA